MKRSWLTKRPHRPLYHLPACFARSQFLSLSRTTALTRARRRALGNISSNEWSRTMRSHVERDHSPLPNFGLQCNNSIGWIFSAAHDGLSSSHGKAAPDLLVEISSAWFKPSSERNRLSEASALPRWGVDSLGFFVERPAEQWLYSGWVGRSICIL